MARNAQSLMALAFQIERRLKTWHRDNAGEPSDRARTTRDGFEGPALGGAFAIPGGGAQPASGAKRAVK